MGFTQISAPIGERPGAALPADDARPDRFAVIDTLRLAAPSLGLKPAVVATLEVLLSCLPPRRRHDVVFASNATLTFRRSGLSERSLRRHVVKLEEAGLLIRHDSTNGKRYTCHDPDGQGVLRFGFDLAPLFARIDELQHLAEAQRQMDRRRSFLRQRLRAALSRVLDQEPEHPEALEARRMLRRNLDLATLELMVQDWPEHPLQASDTPPPATDLSGDDGQIVRHHPKSNTEEKDSKDQSLAIPALLQACPEAASYLQGKPRSVAEVVAHARMLAPMMGIDASTYSLAEDRLGQTGTALTIWAVLQLQGKVRQLGAYFRALTSGRRAQGFDPWTLIDRLSRQQARAT